MKILPKILILMMCMVPLGAEELPTITLDEVISAAAENNLGLRQSEITLNQAIMKQNSIMTTYMPTLSASGSASTGASFISSHNPITTIDPGFTGLDISAGLDARFTFTGNMITDAESRALQKESASITYRSDYHTLVLEVFSDYWTLAADDLDIETQRLALEEAEASYLSTKEMYESGMASEIIFAQAEQAYEAQKLSLKTAEDTKALDMISFRAKTGITGDFQTEELPETIYLALPEASVLFAEYADSSLAIQSATNALNLAKNYEKTMTMTQYVPCADVNRRSAKEDTKKTALMVDEAKNSYLEGIEKLRTTIEQLQDSIRMNEKMRDLYKKTYDLAKESYDAGLMSADDLSSARNDYLTAEMTLTNMRVTHLTTSASLADTLGITLEELQSLYGIPQEEKA